MSFSMQETVLVLLTLVCVYTDIRYRKIYNHFTLPGMILGIGINAVTGGWEGLGFAVSGFLVGGLVLMILYLAGGVGAGDIKFLAAAGALKGPGYILEAAVYGIILGGVFVLLYMLVTGRLIRLLKDTAEIMKRTMVMRKLDVTSFETDRTYIPYGVFLGVGVLIRLAADKL